MIGKILIGTALAAGAYVAYDRITGLQELSEKLEVSHGTPRLRLEGIAIPNIKLKNPTRGYLYIQMPRIQVFLSPQDAAQGNIFLDSGQRELPEPVKIPAHGGASIPDITFPISSAHLNDLRNLPISDGKITIVQRTITPIRLAGQWLAQSEDEPTEIDINALLQEQAGKIGQSVKDWAAGVLSKAKGTPGIPTAQAPTFNPMLL